jgi:enoyl-CoA hydratase/carnithine racemase
LYRKITILNTCIFYNKKKGIKVGLFCSTPGVSLARAMNSTKKSFEMLCIGETITAKEAFQYGLVNYVVENETELENKINFLTQKIINLPSDVISIGKSMFYEQINLNEKDAYKSAGSCMVDNLHHQNTKEGIDSFFEKRDPKWK